MNAIFNTKINKLPLKMQTLFIQIDELIISNNNLINTKMFAGLPTYYLDDNFIRVIPFANHLNIEASNKALLCQIFNNHTFTPKGMLQLYEDDEIDKIKFKELIIRLFK